MCTDENKQTNEGQILGLHMNYRKQQGDIGESMVADHLQKNGYTILVKNYSLRVGEVDIIALKGDTLAFVEVKWRRNPLFDTSEIITYTKQQKIIRAAKTFLATLSNQEKVCRFDVALIENNNDNIQLRYIANAFYAE